MSFDPTKQRGRRFFAARPNAADRSIGELYLYDAIGLADFFGGISAADVAKELDDLKAKGARALNVYLNSPGGDVFEGVAIHSLLQRFPGTKTVFVDGLAASIASVIAMAGDRIVTAPAAMWMIHNPWGMAVGSAAELRDTADKLDKVREVILAAYSGRTKQSAEDLRAWMDAETWMDAATAKARGFTDEITADENAPQASAAFPLLDKYTKTPEPLREQARAASSLLAHMETRIMQHKIGRASPAT